MQPPSTKNGDIQSLRGIAILFVMLQHYRGRLPTPSQYHAVFNHFAFWSGVDIFFAISGFVIAKSLFDTRSKSLDSKLSHLEWRAFWIRRISRLLPGAWLWASIAFLLAPVLASTSNHELIPVLKGSLAAIFGVSNIYWWDCVAHAKIGISCGNPDINGIYWSLSLEEQFYLIASVGLVFLTLKKFIQFALPLVIITSILFSYPPFSLPWVLRPQALLLGVAAFCLTRRLPSLASNASISIRSMRMGTMAISILVIASAPVATTTFAVPIIAVFSALLVLAAAQGSAWSTLLIGRMLAWTGERSYSIYLCHLLVFLSIREIITRVSGVPADNINGAGIFCVVFPISLATAALVGHLSYRYFEYPLAALGRSKST